MKADFRIWSSAPKKGFAEISPPRNLPAPLDELEWHLLAKGSGGVTCELRSRGKLADNVHGAGAPIVSSRVRKIVGEKEVCYGPVTIGDQATHFLMLASGQTSTLDWDDADVTWHRSGAVQRMRGMPLDARVIAERRIASPDGLPLSVLLVREDLRRKLEAASLTGLAFVAPSKFSYDRPPPQKKKATKVAASSQERIQAAARAAAAKSPDLDDGLVEALGVRKKTPRQKLAKLVGSLIEDTWVFSGEDETRAQLGALDGPAIKLARRAFTEGYLDRLEQIIKDAQR